MARLTSNVLQAVVVLLALGSVFLPLPHWMSVGESLRVEEWGWMPLSFGPLFLAVVIVLRRLGLSPARWSRRQCTAFSGVLGVLAMQASLTGWLIVGGR
jgi:hypothetical protein